MAQAIGPHFETYLSVVAQVLNQSSTMTLTDGAFELFDYFISLREGILDAWDGAILAMKQGKCKYGNHRFWWILMAVSRCFESLRRVDFQIHPSGRSRPESK